MRQLVYISSARGIEPGAIEDILVTSRRNNARDGITGLLFSDGTRFLQVLEGSSALVDAAFERIRQDSRHRAIVSLSTRSIETREFGDWEMAHRTPGPNGNAFIRRVAFLTRDADPNVRATFESFAQLRRAA